jgi:hypothetical protein
VRRASVALVTLLLAAAVGACSGSKAPTAPTPSVGDTSRSATTQAAPTPTTKARPTVALPRGGEPVHLDPATFTSEIDNPWWPMKPGYRWAFREGSSLDNVTVTSRTKTIMGIQARVVHDVLTENGQVQEDTFDWYAQDADGNVWYMGEDTREFKDGKVSSTEGSWQAGVKNAQPGILIPARPRPGLAYRQEYLKGQAEDRAKVLSLTGSGKVPHGAFDHALLTEDTTPLEPDVVEHKYYVKGLGPVLAVTVSGGSGREELLSFTPGG